MEPPPELMAAASGGGGVRKRCEDRRGWTPGTATAPHQLHHCKKEYSSRFWCRAGEGAASGPEQPGHAPGAARCGQAGIPQPGTAAWHGSALYGAVRCCTAAARRQCPLEAATHSPRRHRADCTVPDCDHPVPGAQLSSEPPGHSGCFWGAGSHPPAALQWGEAPGDPAQRECPVPPRT